MTFKRDREGRVLRVCLCGVWRSSVESRLYVSLSFLLFKAHTYTHLGEGLTRDGDGIRFPHTRSLVHSPGHK
jgi:hypothetical protein